MSNLVVPRAATALRPVAEKAAPSEPAQGTAPPSTKLDLLMDAELDVTLRFGKRSMLLREGWNWMPAQSLH